MKSYLLKERTIPCDDTWDVIVAGGAWEKGDDKGARQPVTHCFTLTNVDMYAYRHGRKLKYGDANPALDESVDALDTDKLRAILKKNGAYLP